jgi:hypothetical protein
MNHQEDHSVVQATKTNSASGKPSRENAGFSLGTGDITHWLKVTLCNEKSDRLIQAVIQFSDFSPSRIAN